MPFHNYVRLYHIQEPAYKNNFHKSAEQCPQRPQMCTSQIQVRSRNNISLAIMYIAIQLYTHQLCECTVLRNIHGAEKD